MSEKLNFLQVRKKRQCAMHARAYCRSVREITHGRVPHMHGTHTSRMPQASLNKQGQDMEAALARTVHKKTVPQTDAKPKYMLRTDLRCACLRVVCAARVWQ